MKLNWTLFLFAFCSVDSYKILVYNSKYAHSHSNFMGRIADVLVDAGHNVTSLISIMDPRLADGTSKSKKIYFPQTPESAEAFAGFNTVMEHLFDSSTFSIAGGNWLGSSFGKMHSAQCRAIIEDVKFVELLKAEKYDVMLMENFDMCGVALTELIKPKSFISTASCAAFGPHFEEFGIPEGASYSPEIYLSRFDVHSIYDRALNLYTRWLTRFTYGQIRTAIDALFRERFGPSFPSVTEISSNSAYIFVNSEPLIDFATPTINKIIPIGGIGAKEQNKLSEDWEKILAKREKTVLLSFGSVAKSIFLPIEIKMSIIETIKLLPHYTFIWKYEEDDDFTKNIASNVTNLELTKWMPQSELLAHPRLSVFITHSGMGSTQETALRGTPGVFVPLFADQPRNALQMEHNGLGKVFDKYDLTNSKKFAAAIREVIEDDTYRENSKRISAMLHKKPFNVKEQILKYTEFAAEFGASKALRPQSHDMNYIEYYNLDIILIGLIVSLTFIAVSLKFFCFLLSKVLIRSKEKTN